MQKMQRMENRETKEGWKTREETAGGEPEGKAADPQPVLLVTGFEPFGGESVNPSWQAVELLPETIRGARVRKLCLPVLFGESARLLQEKIEEWEPAAVLCVGQAGGRAVVTVERTGINWAEASIPDNGGYTASGEKLEPEGWDGYFSTLPLGRVVEAVRACGVPAQVSESAGAYVCNQLLYRLLHFLKTTGREIPGGFIHIPYSPEQAAAQKGGVPCLPVELSARALEAALAALLEPEAE